MTKVIEFDDGTPQALLRDLKSYIDTGKVKGFIFVTTEYDTSVHWAYSSRLNIAAALATLDIVKARLLIDFEKVMRVDPTEEPPDD